MVLNNLRRWCGYATMMSGVMLFLGGLIMAATIWGGESLDLAFSLLLGLSQFLLVMVLLGILIALIHQSGSLLLTGFFTAVLGVQFDLADFFSPLGSAVLLVGLILMAAALPVGPGRLRLGLWGWILANALALTSSFLGLGLLLAAAVCLAGGARLVIGYELLQPES